MAHFYRSTCEVRVPKEYGRGRVPTFFHRRSFGLLAPVSPSPVHGKTKTSRCLSKPSRMAVPYGKNNNGKIAQDREETGVWVTRAGESDPLKKEGTQCDHLIPYSLDRLEDQG